MPLNSFTLNGGIFMDKIPSTRYSYQVSFIFTSMKVILTALLFFAINAQAQTKQKVWKTFVCDKMTYRIVHIAYKEAQDSIFIQKNIKGKWITDASNFMPSEGATYKDVNADGYLDISLQMRFGQVIFLYNPKQKKYVAMGEVSYEGFTKAGTQKNIWYTFIQYKKTHEWWAQLFTIIDSKKVLLAELVAEPNTVEEDNPKFDELFDSSYGSIAYREYAKGEFMIIEKYEGKKADNLLQGKEDEIILAKKWLLKMYHTK